MNCALLNCPFCNHAVTMQVKDDNESPTGRRYSVMCCCGGPDYTVKRCGETSYECANRWNTRYINTIDALIAASKEICHWRDHPDLPAGRDNKCLNDDIVNLCLVLKFGYKEEI